MELFWGLFTNLGSKKAASITFENWFDIISFEWEIGHQDDADILTLDTG